MPSLPLLLPLSLSPQQWYQDSTGTAALMNNRLQVTLLGSGAGGSGVGSSRAGTQGPG